MTRLSSVRFEVWCEDREQESFARELLCEMGVGRRQFKFHVAPSGAGAASAWVLAQAEDIALRARVSRNQGSLKFVVIVDGDNQPGNRRLAIEALGQEDRRRMACWVPTWSIETWVLWLTGEDVDETRSHKPLLRKPDFYEKLTRAIEAWSVPRSGEEERVPSLAAARRELSRVCPD